MSRDGDAKRGAHGGPLGCAAALAHRALVTTATLGFVKARRGLRVTVGTLERAGASADAGDGHAGKEPAGPAELMVLTDGGALADEELPAAMARVRARLEDTGVVALVVGSPITHALVAAAADEVVALSGARDDAYARAIVWAAELSKTEQLAPALDSRRLAMLVTSAAASDLSLVEPELAALSPTLARVRGMASPLARAVLATVALGARARPLVLVPSRLAPKGGVARPKVERLVDSWVEPAGLADGDVAGNALGRAAVAVLADVGRAARGPMPFKVLLRESRERGSAAARASGNRFTPSSSDARELAAELHHLAAAERVVLYALDPHDPGWTLTILPGAPTVE